jgi:hypothetical protein
LHQIHRQSFPSNSHYGNWKNETESWVLQKLGAVYKFSLCLKWDISLILRSFLQGFWFFHSQFQPAIKFVVYISFHGMKYNVRGPKIKSCRKTQNSQLTLHNIFNFSERMWDLRFSWWWGGRWCSLGLWCSVVS